jgi:hypothetical protein
MKPEKAFVLKTVKPPQRAVMRISTAKYLSPARVREITIRKLRTKESITRSFGRARERTHMINPSDIDEYTMKAGVLIASRNCFGESCDTERYQLQSALYR